MNQAPQATTSHAPDADEYDRWVLRDMAPEEFEAFKEYTLRSMRAFEGMNPRFQLPAERATRERNVRLVSDIEDERAGRKPQPRRLEEVAGTTPSGIILLERACPVCREPRTVTESSDKGWTSICPNGHESSHPNSVQFYEAEDATPEDFPTESTAP